MRLSPRNPVSCVRADDDVGERLKDTFISFTPGHIMMFKQTVCGVCVELLDLASVSAPAQAQTPALTTTTTATPAMTTSTRAAAKRAVTTYVPPHRQQAAQRWAWNELLGL